MGAEQPADKELTEDKKPLSRGERIAGALEQRFAPAKVAVVDDSARHAGHAGAAKAGETHYRVAVVAAAFEGLSRLARQRLVNELLREEFENGLHALSLDLKSPHEAPQPA